MREGKMCEGKMPGGKMRGGKICEGKIREGKMCEEKMCEEKMCEGKRKWNCVSIYGMIGIAIGMSCAACVPYVIRQLADKTA